MLVAITLPLGTVGNFNITGAAAAVTASHRKLDITMLCFPYSKKWGKSS